MKQRYCVHFNEVDANYQTILRRNLNASGVYPALAGSKPASETVPIHALQWQDLGDSLGPINKYSVLLVLGNSICLVKPRDRAKCLTEFWAALFEPGMLIVDERNFAAMEASSSAILRDPLANFSPTHEPDVVYRGDKIRGYPSGFGEKDLDGARYVDWWIFHYDERLTSGEIPSRRIGSKPFRLYPFEHGDLFKMLKSKFAHVDVYADLRLVGQDQMPSVEEVKNSLFLTYVARKGPKGKEG